MGDFCAECSYKATTQVEFTNEKRLPHGNLYI
jgi:hypothetical protein